MRSARVLVTLAVAVGAAGATLATGCGASSEGSSLPAATDAGRDEGDVSKGDVDASVHLVLVNGLTGRADSGLTEFLDVRVCVGSIGSALPQTGTMPLSNYPGVARGRGVDLGALAQLPSQGSELHVFDANTVRGKPDDSCAALLATGGSGAASHRTVTFEQPLVLGNHYLLVLTDVNGSMSLQTAALEDVYKGSSEAGTSVLAQFGLFSAWPKGPFSVQLQEANVPAKTLLSGVAPSVVASAAAPISIPSTASYETLSLAFVSDVAGANPPQWVQSLASIQYVSDPTTDPLGFFDRRQNFVFVVVGDPSDLSVLADGGRNPSFQGSGLHVVAVPYD